MPAITGVSLLTQFEELKTIIRALLISVGSKDVTPIELDKIYHQELDQHIPYKDHNFTNLIDFLKSMNDVCYLQTNNRNQLCVYHIDNDKTKHISELVSKAKKKNKPNKNWAKLNGLRNGNTVNPMTLMCIFNSLSLKSSGGNRNVISKKEVLSELEKYGGHSFFNMNNLDNQLNFYSHILKYDDEKIYFKINNKSECTKNISQFTTPLLSNLCDMIRETTLSNLQKLVEKYTDGVPCTELPFIYCREYKRDLEYTNLGFNGIIEFVVALPNVLKLVLNPNSKQHLVIDAKRSEKDFLDSLNSVNCYKECNTKSVEVVSDAIPKVVSPGVTKTLIPNNVISCDEAIQQICVTMLDTDIDVVVSEVFYPSFFWITLLKNKKKINNFVEKMNQFYNMEDLEKYKIPPVVLRPGLNVACTFDDIWYRGIIKKIERNNVIVLLYDYGTVNHYKSKDVYFLNKKFFALPAQAIPCSLYNVQPVNKIKWEKEPCKIFSQNVLNKSFSATIKSVDKVINHMVLSLTDVKKFNLNINKWIVSNKLAIEGQFFCAKNYNTLKYYQLCFKNPLALQEESFKKERNDKRNDERSCKTESFTQNYLSKSKKLEALQKYRARLSSSSSTTSTEVYEIKEKESSQEIEDVKEVEENENSINDLSKDLDDAAETTLSDIVSSECSTESKSNYKITEHESSYTISSNSSTLSPLSKKTSLDSDDTGPISSMNCMSNETFFKNCNSSLQFKASNATCSENLRKSNVEKKSRDKNFIIPLNEMHRLMISTKK